MITKIPKFRRCIIQNFPFIEEDFDALTDYELLCKVVEFLNKVISSQNEVIQELDDFETSINSSFETFTTNITGDFNALSDKFDELKSYVDNYFDNLDVQDEINQKLDDMVEQGTLQEIITTYIQSNVAWTFDTVADMKLATNLVNGSYAQTLGFYSLNDGGGAIYKISNTGTANEIDVIAVGSLYAKLTPSKTMSIKCFGSNSNEDNSAILARAFKYCYDNNSELLIDHAISFETPLTIADVPNFRCTQALTYTGGENTTAMIIGTTTELNMLNMDIMLKNENKSTTTVGVKFQNINTSKITLRYIFQFGIGCVFSGNEHGCCYNEIDLLNLFYNETAIKLISESNGWCNENKFNNGKIQYRNSEDYSNAIGFDLVGVSDRRINNNVFIKPAFEYLNKGIKISYGTSNEVYNGRFESVNYACDIDANSRVNIINVGYGNVGSIINQGTNIVTSCASNAINGKVKIYDVDLYADSVIEEYQGNNRLVTTNFCIMNSGGSTTKTIASDDNYELTAGYFVQKVNQKGFGVFIDCSSVKKFYLKKQTALGYAGRYLIKLYDVDKNAISTSTISSVDGSGALLANNDVSNSFRNSGNFDTDFLVVIPDAAKYVFIGGTKVGDNIKVNRYEIYAEAPTEVKTALADFS